MSNEYEKRLGIFHKAESFIKTYAINSGTSRRHQTQSPKAHTGLLREGETGLFNIAICTALSRDQAEAGQSDNLHKISLA